jgi:hypothetical protein
LRVHVPGYDKPMYVWPVLGWVSGDIPFLAKMSNSVGHGAKAACYRCCMQGFWHKHANTVRREPALHLPCPANRDTMFHRSTQKVRA